MGRFLVPATLALLVACGSVFCTASPAHAYVLAPEFLLRVLAEARREHGARDVSLQLNAEVAGHEHPLDEHLYMKRPERYRLVQQDDTSHIFVDKEGIAAEGEDRIQRTLPGPSTNLLPLLLFPKGKDLDEMQVHMVKALQAVGVDMSVVTLGRVNDSPVYVIGAHNWEPGKAQVWLDKATYVPLRYTVPVKIGDKLVVRETRLLDYGAGPGGAAFPRIIENYEDGKLVRHAEVTAAKFNQDLPETLFDLRTRTK